MTVFRQPLRPLFLVILLTGCAAAGRPSPEPISADLAIVGVHVVDVETGEVMSDRTVLVRADRIVFVGASASTPVSAAARRVDAAGLYLIPGLWDMHVHVMYTGGYDVLGPLFLAMGITGLRDMGNSPMSHDESSRLLAAVRAGERIGPRFVAAGRIVDGGTSFWELALRVPDAIAARALVDSLHTAGATFLKVYSGLTLESYGAIMDRARELRLPVDGHVPTAVPIASASAAGQRSMEHLLGMIEGCAANEEELAAERARLLADARAAGVGLAVDLLDRRVFVLARHDERRCASLLTSFERNRNWQVPTLTLMRAGAFPADAAIREDERLRYLAPWLHTWWRDPADTTAVAWEQRAGRFRYLSALVGAMQQMGVPILAGSDTPNRFVFPAFSLHQELVELVDAGLTPLEALRTATLSPARFLSATDSLGAVKPGRLADLVLLEANPLHDIRNTQRIAGVVFGGRYRERSELDALKEDAAAAAAALRSRASGDGP